MHEGQTYPCIMADDGVRSGRPTIGETRIGVGLYVNGSPENTSLEFAPLSGSQAYDCLAHFERLARSTQTTFDCQPNLL